MLNKLVVVVITIIFSTGISQAAIDCNAPPNFRPLKNCCRLPEPDQKEFPECTKYMKQPGKQAFTCSSSCFFNSTSALDGDRLNFTNLRVALARLFKFDSTILDETIIPAFKECEKEIDLTKANYKFYNKAWRGNECPFLPQMYFICAGRKVLVNCPNQLWTASDECQMVKEYITNCDGSLEARGRFFGRRGINRAGVKFF